MTNSWPTGADAWIAYAARCTAHYPDMLTDWDAHAKMMQARRNSAIDASVSSGVAFDGDLPLSLEEEEELQNCRAGVESSGEESAQMQLFSW